MIDDLINLWSIKTIAPFQAWDIGLDKKKKKTFYKNDIDKHDDVRQTLRRTITQRKYNKSNQELMNTEIAIKQ